MWILDMSKDQPAQMTLSRTISLTRALYLLIAALASTTILVASSFEDAHADSPDYKISLLPGGTEMEYSGRIAFGASSALRSALNDNPGVKILHLNSNGGSVYWARQMQAIVRDFSANTIDDKNSTWPLR